MVGILLFHSLLPSKCKKDDNMQAIKMNRHIDSEILHLPMPKDMIWMRK